MIASPYGFLRGAAAIVAEDFAHLPSTGISPIICGGAHLGNFGFYASPNAISSSTSMTSTKPIREPGVGSAPTGDPRLGCRSPKRFP